MAIPGVQQSEAGTTEQQPLLSQCASLETESSTGLFSSSSQQLFQNTSTAEMFDDDNPILTRRCLFASYALAAWAWRSWEFTVALVLIDLYPGTLLLVSVYGLLDDLVRVTLGAAVGKYISRAKRLPGATNAYLCQNICILGSAASTLVVEHFFGQRVQNVSGKLVLAHPVGFGIFISVAIILGSLSSVGSTGVMIAVERQMTKVVCGDQADVLSKMNAGMRAIDLACLLAAPCLAGVLMTSLGSTAAVWLLAAYAGAAWLPELWLLRRAFSYSKALRESKPTPEPEPSAVPTKHHDWLHNWRVYARQPMLLPNLALALLYMTVLSLGFLMTSYLKWVGLTEAEVSVYRGVGALTGLLATVLWPILQRKIGMTGSANLGIWYQLSCLSAGVLPILVVAAAAAGFQHVPSASAVRVLVAGLVASRTGLWLFDLAVNQMVQEGVHPDELGIVCGVQSSLQAFFETISFVVSFAFPHPASFPVLMLGSLAAVAAAAVLQTVYAVKQAWSRQPVPGYEEVQTEA